MKNLKALVDLATDCRKWRESRGLYQKDIALDAGYKPQYISLFERGMANNALILAAYIRRGYTIGKAD